MNYTRINYYTTQWYCCLFGGFAVRLGFLLRPHRHGFDIERTAQDFRYRFDSRTAKTYRYGVVSFSHYYCVKNRLFPTTDYDVWPPRRLMLKTPPPPPADRWNFHHFRHNFFFVAKNIDHAIFVQSLVWPKLRFFSPDHIRYPISLAGSPNGTRVSWWTIGFYIYNIIFSVLHFQCLYAQLKTVEMTDNMTRNYNSHTPRPEPDVTKQVSLKNVYIFFFWYNI